MANKQYLIEIAVGNTKLKSSLKKALEDPSVQKELGILGEGITEHLEKDVGKAASILGKVDWASLLGKKDFEDLQQLVAKTVSANKDMIKSFIKSGDTQGIRDTIELVSELGKELKAINPDETVAGLTRSMNSFITTLKPISDTLNGMVNGSQRFAGALQNLLDNFDTTTINKNIKETSDIVANTLKAMNTKSAKNALKTMFEEAYGSAEKMEDALLSSDAMNAYLSKFETAKSIAEEMNRLMKESEKGVRDIKGRLIYKQQLEGLQGKLAPMLPTLDGSAIKKEAKTISKDLDVTIEEITDKLEKSFNKTIEDKLSSIKVKIDVPTEEQLISDINKVIEKVNQNGTSSLKLVGAESAINTAQKQILENTKKWHDDMRTYLKFDKKEDITLDLGVKMREIGSNIGEQMQRSIEEYFDNPENKVSIPVELIISDKNKAILEGSNVTVVGGGGGGEITAESLAKALTTPIEVKVQEKKEKQKPDRNLISIDREGQFAQEIIDTFEEIFKLIERGGKNANSIDQVFDQKGINLKELNKLSGVKRDNEIIFAFETLLESGDASLLDQIQKLTKGSTKSRAIIDLRDLIQDSVLRFDLKQISTQEDVKRRQVRNLVEENYIPKSIAQESLYKIRNTNAKDYQIPTLEELNKLMEDLPQVWVELGKDFLPALEALKQLRSEITDPTNATEIQRFKDAADEFASNTDPLYREMSDFMHGYKIGVFNKGHNKHDPYYDYAVKGGVFSGSKLLANLDKVDYFESYDDPAGHFSRGNRKDAMDNASRLDRYQHRRDARNASYRTREPERTKVSAEDIEVKKFEPKTRVDEEVNEIDEINYQKESAKSRVKAMEEARKASIEEEKAAEELRKQQLETDKKKRTVLKGRITKNENKIKNIKTYKAIKIQAENKQLKEEIDELNERISKNSIEPSKKPIVTDSEIQLMIDNINAFPAEIDKAIKQANELDEWVSKNFKEEKNTDIDYTKLQKNNQNKNKDKKNWVYVLNQLLTEKDRTKLSSLTGMNKRDVKVVSNLLHNRKIYQLINGKEGLGLQKNSSLEDIVKYKLQTYQNGLNKIDEFLLKYKDQTLRYIEDDPDLIEFMKDNDVKRMLVGTFNGSQEEGNAIKEKIDKFKARMTKAGKSYILDYIDMWSNENLRELMKNDGVKKRTATDAEGSSILMKFYNKILKGGFGKRDEAYQYLKNESEKHKKNIKKNELSLENIIVSRYNQTEMGDIKDQRAENELKDKYKKYISEWLYTIQDNMYSVLFGELDDKDAALKTKKNDELRNIVMSAAEKYHKLFGEELLTEFQKEFLQKTNGEYNDFKNQDVQILFDMMGDASHQADEIIAEKAELLKQRRFDLLKNISDRANKGEDTASLQKALLEVENELIKYSDMPSYSLQNEFEADLLNAKNATDEEWKKFRENATKRQSEYEAERYPELKVKKKALLDEISAKTKKGESTSNLEEQLKNINKELTQYEITASRMEDTKKSIFPDDASTRAIQVYNIEMKKLVELLHEKEYLEAKGKDASDINIKIARQKRKTYNNIKQRVNEDKKIDAEYDPKTQASKFIEETDADLYRLQQAESDARRRLNDANSRLATIQGDKYYNSTLYKERIESLKDADIAEYINSGEFKADRDRGIKEADKDFGEYLTQQLGEDVAQRIVQELSQNKDRANIDSIITTEEEAIELEKQRLEELYQKREQLLDELSKNSDDAIKSKTIQAKIESIEEEIKNGKIIGGMGNTSRLVSNSFSESVSIARQNYINSDEYKKIVEEAKANREKEIEEKLKIDKSETDAKVQEIWNTTKANIKRLKGSTLENSEELRNAVESQAKIDGMGDSTEYKKSIVDQVREDLIQETIEAGRQEQKYYNKQYYDKAREMRSQLSPNMYQKLNEKADEVAYNVVMAKIQGLIGDNKDLLKGLYDKRNEFIEGRVGNLIEKRRNSLSTGETGQYFSMAMGETVNVRDQLEKELAHEVDFYEQKYIEASGKLGALQHQRSSAMSFGELGTTEVDNPKIARIRAEAEASLSAEKAKQINLTEKLTNLAAQNANPQLINSVSAALSATEKEIERLTLLIESASSALSIRQEAKDVAEAEKKFTPEKLRLWYIDQIQRQKGLMENGTDKQKEKAPAIIAKMEQKLADVERRIEESKPESEKPKTVLDMIAHSIRDGLANVTSGGTVNLDASLYNIATETTLQEILRLLGGNGAVDYANQLKSGLEKYRPRNEGKSSEGSGYRSNSGTTNKKQRKNNSLDKLNEEGQRIYGELDAEAKAFISSLKNGRKEYDDNFDFVKAIKEQAKVVRSKTKGDLEYIKEQTKLTVLYQDYYGKTFGKGKKKKGQPSQSTWATQGELGKIDDLEDLLLFKYKRADALVGLNYGIEGITQVDDVVSESKPKKNTKKKTTKKKSIPDAVTSDDNQVVNKIMTNELEARGITNIDEEDMSDIIKSANELILNLTHGDGLGRDIDDNILSTKGETSQVLYDAIVDGYKAAASGDKIFAETSYSLDELGNVVDVKRGTMLNSAPPEFASVFGHTHPSDKLFGSNDFKSAAAGKGIIDVLELITPLNKYKISGLKNINPDELAKKFAELAVIAQKFENFPSSIYNTTMKSAILAQGLNLTETPMNIDPSNNFQLVRNASILQSVSNHELPLAPFEKVLYSFVAELKDIGYQFDKGSPLDQLVDSIITIQQTKYNSTFEKEWDIEGLRPLIEEAFGVNPLAQISQQDRDMLTQISDKVPYLRLEIDDRGVELAGYGKQLFSDGKNLSGEEAYKPDDGLGRDNGAKKDKKSTHSTTNKNSNTTYVNSKNTNNSASDNKMPYDVDPDSLIGRLQNTVGGSTKPLAEQATLVLVLTTLQEISNKIPTIGKSGVKSSAQNLLEEFQKMAIGSSMDGKERVAYFDSVNGVMSPSLSGATHSISQKLINSLSGPYGADKGYRSRIHTHADSDQTWFSKKDLNYFKNNIGDFNADSVKQEILLTNDTITVFDMTMVETAEKAKQAIDILINAGSNIDNIVIEKLSELGARYQSKDFGSIGAKGLMDLIGVKNYKNDGKKKGAVANPEVALKGLEAYAKSDADKRNSKYVFNSFDGETLKYQLVDIEGHISKVILVWDELEKKVRVVSDTSTSSIDAVTRKIQQYHNEIKNAQNEKLLSDGDDADFVAAQEEVDKIIKQIESEDLSGQKLSEAIDALDAAREKLAEEGKKLHKLVAKNDRLRNGTPEVKSAITQGTKVRSLVGDLIQTDEQDGLQLFDFSDDAPKYLQDYILQYNDLVRIQQQYIKDGQINNPKIQDALKVQANKVKELGMEAMTAYQKTLNLQEQSDKWESQKYTDRAGKEHSLGGSKYVGFQGVDRATMLQYAKEVLGADLASAKLNTTTGKLTGVLRKNNRVVADMAVVYDESTGKLHLFQEKERESLSGLPGFMNALKAKSKAIAQYLMSMTSIYRVLGEIRQGIQYVKEIDLALTELKKVTDETDETYEKFLDTASKTASKVGSTIKDVVSSTADWARLGYSIQEATQLAESTQILMNVSEFTDISTATDSLISSIQAFKYTAEESMDVVDILNTIGNNYAISTADLATSLTKSSGSLVAANGTLEEAVALTATANTIIQDADVVGTALKTVAMRLRGKVYALLYSNIQLVCA